MACPRCGSDCSCACSGDPIPAQDWRRQVSLQVRAHKRKRRRLDPDSPELNFDEQAPLHIEETPTAAVRKSSWRWDEGVLATAVAPAPQAAENSQTSDPTVDVPRTRVE